MHFALGKRIVLGLWVYYRLFEVKRGLPKLRVCDTMEKFGQIFHLNIHAFRYKKDTKAYLDKSRHAL